VVTTATKQKALDNSYGIAFAGCSWLPRGAIMLPAFRATVA